MTNNKQHAEELGRPVVVTTAHRGVFFGYTEKTDGEIVTLKQAQLCLYWSADVRGFMGLAAAGPTKGCRIGPPVESIELRSITSVQDASAEAVAAWKAQPWAR